MTLGQADFKKSQKQSILALVNVSGLLLLSWSLGGHAATIEAPSWYEIDLNSPAEQSERNTLDAALPSGKGVLTSFGDLTQCRVNKEAGAIGILSMSEAGYTGPFVAVLWNADGSLTATLRCSRDLPVESFKLRDVGNTELILLRRDRTVYAYAVEDNRIDPLIAIDFPSESDLVAGMVSEKNHGVPHPAISAVASAPVLTGDVKQNQRGAELNGIWSPEENIGSLGGIHLVNDGDDANASATLTLENLLPGTHELWIRYAAMKSRTKEAEVTVGGFAQVTSLIVNQRISGGVWLSLGRFETNSDTTATINLKSAHPGSGSLSVDALHLVGPAWEDIKQDQNTSSHEIAAEPGPRATTMSVRSGGGEPTSGGFSNVVDSLSKAGEEAAKDTAKVVIFVNGSLGNDSYDGRLSKPQRGAWFSMRGGPMVCKPT